MVEQEIIKRPKLEPLFESPVKLRRSPTHIEKMDQCSSLDMPGIVTTTSTITEEGFPVINGFPDLIKDGNLNIPF